MRTPESFHIMVTDVNHHVRDLLKRELEQEGYTVYSARTDIIFHQYICSPAPLDLIILDPELFHPYDQSFIVERVQQRNSSIQIIIHSYSDKLSGLKTSDNIHLVKKNAESIDTLKSTVRNCFLLP